VIRVFKLDSIARLIGVGSTATVVRYAKRAVDPLRLWRVHGRIFAWDERAKLWVDRTFNEDCAQPRAEGLYAIGEAVGLRDDEAILRLIRRAKDPIPTWYDGRKLVAWQSALEDWSEAQTRAAFAVEEEQEAAT
jgi:hypothetical protein